MSSSAVLNPLEIYIEKRDTTSMLVSWGRVIDTGLEEGESVVYELSWFGAEDQSDLKMRETEYNEWLIQGLLPGKEYYVNVEYQSLESPNKAYFTTGKCQYRVFPKKWDKMELWTKAGFTYSAVVDLFKIVSLGFFCCNHI